LSGRLLLAIAIALLLIAPETAAAADRYTVQRPLASLRNAPGSFAIGHVFRGAAVDVVARAPGWVYVNAAGKCGWLMDERLAATGAVTGATCPDPGALAPERLFAPGSYQRASGEGCVYPSRVVPCADRTVYANYDGGGAFRDPVEREPLGRGTRGPRVPRYAGVRSGYAGFGLRYVTLDGVAAMIKDARRRMPVWRFIHAECIERLSLLVTSRSIGDFPVRRGLPRAIRAFGRRYARSDCTVGWLRPALTLHFVGPHCRRFAGALITRQPIRGSALVHTWTTPLGLRLGDRVARLRRLYPSARRFHGSYRLEGGLRALVARGRVSAFRVS
jgi:hypothetical protein